jgi:hypothetical protein
MMAVYSRNMSWEGEGDNNKLHYRRNMNKEYINATGCLNTILRGTHGKVRT